MKLLLDENLSPRLADALAHLYPGSKHVAALGLEAVADGDIWAFAKANGFAIVSKDSDFVNRSALKNRSPKVIWIRLGNCSTNDVERLLRSRHGTIREFLDHSRETCLLLGRL